MGNIKISTESLINFFTGTFTMIFILHFIVVMSSTTLINGGYIIKKEFGDLLGIATFTQLIADYMQYLDINYNHFWLDISNFGSVKNYV